MDVVINIILIIVLFALYVYKSKTRAKAGGQQAVSAPDVSGKMSDSVAEVVPPPRASSPKKADRTRPEVHVSPLAGKKKEETSVARLKSLSDARKAFVYSEIFNRKYD